MVNKIISFLWKFIFIVIGRLQVFCINVFTFFVFLIKNTYNTIQLILLLLFNTLIGVLNKIYFFLNTNLCEYKLYTYACYAIRICVTFFLFIFRQIDVLRAAIYNYLYIVYSWVFLKLFVFLFWCGFRKLFFFKKKISKISKKNILFVLLLLFFLFFIKYNLFNYIFNYLYAICQLDIEVICHCFFLENYYQKLNLFLVLLNPDNFLLLLYVFFVKVGVYNLCFMDFSSLKLYVGYTWVDFYITHKQDDSQFSFFYFFFNQLCIYLVDINKLDSLFLYVTDNNNPTFFFFGLFFFLTVIISWFFFSYLGLYGIFILNLLPLFFFWVSLLLCMKDIFFNQNYYNIKLCSWFFLNTNFKLDCYFLIDTVSYSFILLTTTIALFVYIFAFSYFKYEPLVDRFLLFLLSFVISMLFLVASGNIIMLFLGWELIGFTSFCLINFWTTKTATLKSAFKAFSFNKVSDFFLFMFLVFTYSIYYTFDITSINHQIYNNKQHILYFFENQINSTELLAAFLVGSAFIKSAQLGGHAWLPDSMEAPVPASSLIHSATLVSAGVYLILRFNFIFDSTEFVKIIIPLVGSLTAAYGGVCAVAQSDIKKTLAYSTISHCGFLMVCCAVEMNEFTILYLYVHGFFKAGVFMCVGNVLRITRGYQDTRRMGGLLKYLPFEYYCAVIGVLNLAGLPFTLGFVIKHLLLVSLDKHIYLYYFILFNVLLGAFSGLFYSYRLITYTFNDFKKANKSMYAQLNRISYNSYIYTNTSLAPTVSIFSLFLSAYFIVILLFYYFLNNGGCFSDYMNTSIISNYFSMSSSTPGYLLNFSYMNIGVVFIVFYLYFSKFKKIPQQYKTYTILTTFSLLFLFIFIFYNIL